MRLELRDGQWADMRERITHATDKHLKVTIQRGKADPEESFDLDTELARAFVRDWNVQDPDGQSIPIGDADAIERAPDDIVDALARKAVELWTGATVPNPPTPASSDDSPSGSPSESGS